MGRVAIPEHSIVVNGHHGGTTGTEGYPCTDRSSKLFDFRAQLPREANGKLYKRELRDEYQQQAEQQTEQA